MLPCLAFYQLIWGSHEFFPRLASNPNPPDFCLQSS
jgi:hypothetical protein